MQTYGPTTLASDQLHSEKYRTAGETFREAMTRVANALSDDEPHFRALRDILLGMRFLPAGRIQAAAGSLRSVCHHNCFVSGTIEDSFTAGSGSIMSRAREAADTMRMGGGIGYDFSTLRPRGALIRKLNAASSGPLPFMEIFDAIGRATSSAGNRRGAQMGVLRVDHPDIEEFIRAKQNYGKLSGFNISVAVTDEFMEAVKDRRAFDLRFEGSTYRTVDAGALWEMIMRSTYDWADPGVLFIDTINERNNLYYCETLAATNPCVVGNTEILTRRGYQRIDSLVDQEVEVWNGFEWSPVTPSITGKDQPTLTVTFNNGRSLTCTSYHKFLLVDGRRVEAQELRIGDKLPKHVWPIIGERTDEFDTAAYTQGFFSGDGWEDERGRHYIGLYVEKKNCGLVLSQDYISSRDYESTSGFTGEDNGGRVYLYYGKRYFRPKQFVPDASFSYSYRLSWLAGLADADGYLTKDGCLQITSVDRTFLDNICLMLNTLGASGTVSSMKDAWRLSISASDAYDLAPQTCRLSGYVQPQRNASRFVAVTSISEAGVAPLVYCFTEAKRHLGIFNGVLTAQCGEQPLPPYGACLLGSFNLVQYLTRGGPGRAWDFDFAKLHLDISTVVRAMDNVVDRARYPLHEQEREARAKRRMGLGVTGVANTIEAMGYPYASESFLQALSLILANLRNEAYRASALLAREKGAFPLFSRDAYLGGKFIQSLPDDVQDLIYENGIRNSHLLSIAPTGTISFCADNISSGIEPVFATKVKRMVNTLTGLEAMEVEDYGYHFLGVEPKTVADCSVDDHLKVLICASTYVDSAVSKTCNVPSNIDWEAFKDIYVRAWAGNCKGCTTYRMGGKREAILEAADSEPEAVACVYDSETGVRTCDQ